MTSKRTWALDRVAKATQGILQITLIASAAFSAWVVATDDWLRAVAPSHEYGLLTFAILDLLLALVVFVAPRLADISALAVAMVQVVAMLGDAFTFAPVGTPQIAFRAYLLSDFGFVALLAVQLVLAGITTIGAVLAYETGRRAHAMHVSKLRVT